MCGHKNVYNESSANSREVLSETETDSSFTSFDKVKANAYHRCKNCVPMKKGSLSGCGDVSFMMGVKNDEEMFGFYSPSAMKPSPVAVNWEFRTQCACDELKGDEMDKYSKLPKMYSWKSMIHHRTLGLHLFTEQKMLAMNNLRLSVGAIEISNF